MATDTEPPAKLRKIDDDAATADEKSNDHGDGAGENLSPSFAAEVGASEEQSGCSDLSKNSTQPEDARPAKENDETVSESMREREDGVADGEHADDTSQDSIQHVGDVDQDPAVREALELMDSCQNDIDSLNEKASEEILTVELKYNKLRRPHYDKRAAIIDKIPQFWVTAFVNHPQISVILDEEEEECMHSLKRVEVQEFDDIQSGYSISLHFSKNRFFSNPVLTKEFHLSLTGDPVSKSTDITWTGTNLVAKANERKGNRMQLRSFFQWFTDNTDPSADDISDVIKDDMWPNPLQYYLATDMENGVDGEHGDESVVMMGDDDEEDYDEEDEEDDDDDVQEVIDEEDEDDEEDEEDDGIEEVPQQSSEQA